MIRMSMIAFAAAAFSGFLAAGSPAKAADWPWCADMFDGRGGGTATNCGFASRSQCEAYLSGMNGWCYRNPFARREPSRRNSRRG